MKKIRTLVMFILVVCSVGLYTYAQDIDIYIDGMKTQCRAYIDEASRTQVAVRDICDELSADIEWNSDTQEIQISYTGYIAYDDGSGLKLNREIIESNISLKVGDSVIKTGSTDITMDTVAKVVDGNTYVPVKYIVEALGGNVSWNDELKCIDVASPRWNKGSKYYRNWNLAAGEYSIVRDGGEEVYIIILQIYNADIENEMYNANKILRYGFYEDEILYINNLIRKLDNIKMYRGTEMLIKSASGNTIELKYDDAEHELHIILL